MTDVGDDEAIKKIIESLSAEKDIEGKTDLNSIQVVAIARADVYGRRYNSVTMKLLVLLVAKYLQSKGRMGRTELVIALNGLLAYKAEKERKTEVKV